METINTCRDSGTGRATYRILSLEIGMLVFRVLNQLPSNSKKADEGDGMSQDVHKGKPS